MACSGQLYFFSFLMWFMLVILISELWYCLLPLVTACYRDSNNDGEQPPIHDSQNSEEGD
jgi:hypothetical protein